jgi:hypothetical protein
MAEDLISNHFVDNINKVVIKKTFRLTKLILNLVIVYTILDLIDWYIAISKSLGYDLIHVSTFFRYRIHPVIAVVILGISIVCHYWYIKANEFIDKSFEQSDAELFNTGYKYYYQAARLALVSFGISIASISIRLLLK